MITLNPADMSRLIKELREKTGAGITACKKALEAGNWKLDEALTTDHHFEQEGFRRLLG